MPLSSNFKEDLFHCQCQCTSVLTAKAMALDNLFLMRGAWSWSKVPWEDGLIGLGLSFAQPMFLNFFKLVPLSSAFKEDLFHLTVMIVAIFLSQGSLGSKLFYNLLSGSSRATTQILLLHVCHLHASCIWQKNYKRETNQVISKSALRWSFDKKSWQVENGA